jgi:peptidoglycan/xylan/chitin deacetylase (PgdA/CDA1 family)
MKLPNTVINFHVIKDVEWMEKVLILLKKYYTFVSASELEEFYNGEKALINACHITVDDGDISVYYHLFPLIKKYNIPISIYVSPFSTRSGKNFWFQEIRGYDLKILLQLFNRQQNSNFRFKNKEQVNGLLKSLKIEEINRLISTYREEMNLPIKNRINMELSQLIELKKSGLVEIGAHTQTHPILINETFDVALYEIRSSVEELREMLNCEVRYFAYPNGNPSIDFNEREIDILKGCNIKLAFSTDINRFSKRDNPLSIPRIGITKGNRNFILAKLIFGNTWWKLKRLLLWKQEYDYRE